MTIKFGDFVAQVGELALKRDALASRRLEVVLGPGSADRAKAVDPIGKLTNRERIGIRIIILLDHDEISGDEKSWPRGAAREEQDRITRTGERQSIGSLEPSVRPLLEWAAACPVVEAFGCNDLETPRQACLPAEF